jgi:hypothetical protein
VEENGDYDHRSAIGGRKETTMNLEQVQPEAVTTVTVRIKPDGTVVVDVQPPKT